MRKSGEKVEGTRDVSRRPQTTGVHESSRRQVLRFSASLIHRCHSLVGSINRPKRFRLQASRYRHGPPRASRQPGQVRRHLGKMCRRSSVALLNFILVAARKRQRDPRSVPPSGSAVRCRIRSAPAINDRPQNGHSSSLNPCRKMQNVTFSAALKFPLLTSGEPRRRSFLDQRGSSCERGAADGPGKATRRETPVLLKIILVAARGGRRHVPDVALASRRSASLWGRYFACPIRGAPLPHPCSESVRVFRRLSTCGWSRLRSGVPIPSSFSRC